MAVGSEDGSAPLGINSGIRRLHISPLNPTLLPVFLPPSMLPLAKNISYHIIETFPERNYGFVELPVADAERIRKKLNGTTFKGLKVRVEEARPQKQRPNSSDQAVIEPRMKSGESKRQLGKRGREDGVLLGVELPVNRKVQRGWTKPPSTGPKSSKSSKDRKRQPATSSYSTHSECLFRTTLPTNMVSSSTQPLLARTEAKLEQRRVKNKAGRETVVHEFSSTTQYSSFLRGNATPTGGRVVSEFVDGKGWVDNEGNLIEAATETKRPKQVLGELSHKKSTQETEAVPTLKEVPIVEAQESGPDSEEDSTDASDSASEDGSTASTSEMDSKDSDMEDTSESSKDEESGSEEEPSPVKADQELKISTPGSAGLAPKLTLTIPTNTIPSPVRAPALTINIPKSDHIPHLHPLEAVFKHPSTINSVIVKSSVEPATPFTFFEPDAEETETRHSPMPHTPFTKMDLLHRETRSAAPTPDTAAPWKRMPILWPQGVDAEGTDKTDDEVDDHENTPGPSEGPGHGKIAVASTLNSPIQFDDDVWDALPILSDPATRALLKKDTEVEERGGFEKMFYETRGEMNRAWRRRRREVGKEKRKRENKRRERRAI